MFVRLKEDLKMDNDHFGFRTGGGIAKAGTVFKVLAEPSPKKKKYKLEPLNVKFPYHLYLRKNDFLRLFEVVNLPE